MGDTACFADWRAITGNVETRSSFVASLMSTALQIDPYKIEDFVSVQISRIPDR